MFEKRGAQTDRAFRTWSVGRFCGAAARSEALPGPCFRGFRAFYHLSWAAETQFGPTFHTVPEIGGARVLGPPWGLRAMSDTALPKLNGTRGGEEPIRPPADSSASESEVKLPAIASARGSSRNLAGNAGANGAGATQRREQGEESAESGTASPDTREEEVQDEEDDPIAVLASKQPDSQMGSPMAMRDGRKVRSHRGSQEPAHAQPVPHPTVGPPPRLSVALTGVHGELACAGSKG